MGAEYNVIRSIQCGQTADNDLAADSIAAPTQLPTLRFESALLVPRVSFGHKKVYKGRDVVPGRVWADRLWTVERE